MSRSPHAPAALLAPLVVLLTALAALSSPAPTAAQSSHSSQSGTPEHRTSRITGWSAAPSSVRAGAVYQATVRVSGGSRRVALQRKVGGWWRPVEVTRSSRTGRVTLTWTAPRSIARVALRVRAPRAGVRPAGVTRARLVQVRRTSPGTGPDPDPGPGPGPDPDPGTGSVKLPPMLREVLTLVNDARATGYTCGGVRYPAVPPVKVHAKLNRAADKYAQLMATRDFFSHTGPGGSGPGDRIGAEGYDWTTYGENIAAGYTEAASVVEGWLESAGHCRNVMGRFAEIGLGHAYDADSTYGDYWVQDFASR